MVGVYGVKVKTTICAVLLVFSDKGVGGWTKWKKRWRATKTTASHSGVKTSETELLVH